MDLRKRIQWSLLLRVIVASLFLGGSTYYYMRNIAEMLESPTFWYLSGLIIFVYVTSLAVTPFLLRNKWLTGIGYAEIVFDAAFGTALVFVTGADDSIFHFIFILIILQAALTLGKRGAAVCGILSMIGLWAVLLAQFYQFYPFPFSSISLQPLKLDKLIFSSTVNSVAFVIVSILAGILSEQLRKTGEELSKKSAEVERISALHQSIVDSVPSGIFTIDGWDKITFCNRAATQITELPTALLDGAFFKKIFPNAPTVEQLTGNANTAVDISYVTPSQKNKILRLIASPFISPQGTSNQNVIVFNDITNLEQLEKQLAQSERLAAIGKVAAGLAHEIRNPLASVSGVIQMMKMKTAPEQAPLLDMALTETDRLNTLIQELLNYARPRQLNIHPLNISDILSKTVENIQLALSQNKPVPQINFSVNIAQDAMVKGDEDALKQIFINLLKNAIEALRDSQGAISVILSAKNGEIEIKISDSGGGIEQADLKNIFLPFFTTKPHGTGLGLSISHRLIEEQGGTISVNSIKNKGSIFTITFPAASEEPAQTKSKETSVPQTTD